MRTETPLLEPTATTPEPAALNEMCLETQGQSSSELPAPKCDTCGNEYRKAFKLVMNGKTYHFDCFECAIQLLAPACAHCGCTIIGHGMEHHGELYCCHHCARHVNMPPSAADTAPADG